MVGTDAANELFLHARIHGGDFCAHCLGDLDAMRADAAARAVDQHLLALFNVRQPQEVQCIESSQRYRGRFFEAHVGRLRDDRVAGGQADVLAVGAEADAGCAENLVANGEPRNVLPECRNLAGEIAAEDPASRFPDPDSKAQG